MCNRNSAPRRAAHAVVALGLSAAPLLCTAEPLEHQVVVDEEGVPRDCLLLNGASLSTVVAEFNLRNVRQLAIVDPAIEHLGVGGMVCPTRLTSLLGALKALGVDSVGPTGESSGPGVIRLSWSRSMVGLPPGKAPGEKPTYEQSPQANSRNQAHKR
ncbi:MAG: hypothetical protein ABI885_01055 [Gammaproteobacteria bacterium]